MRILYKSLATQAFNNVEHPQRACSKTGMCLIVFIFRSRNKQAMSIFRDDEIDYHKYSAILAATEPFRKRLDNDVKNELGFGYLIHKFKGMPCNELDALA